MKLGFFISPPQRFSSAYHRMWMLRAPSFTMQLCVSKTLKQYFTVQIINYIDGLHNDFILPREGVNLLGQIFVELY